MRTLKGLIISSRAPNGADGGDGNGGWAVFFDNIRLCEGDAVAHHETFNRIMQRQSNF